jgi:hypothetical protein
VTEHDRTARRRLVWLLLTRGDLGAETLRSDGQPALRPPPHPEAEPPPIRKELPRAADAA